MSEFEVEVSNVEEVDGRTYNASAQLNDIFLELIECVEILDASSGEVVFRGSKALADNFPTVLAQLQAVAEDTNQTIDHLVA